MDDTESYEIGRRDPVALTPDARERQLIAKAERLAEKRIDEGTASNQLLVHYLKLGTVRSNLEKELLQAQIALAKAKTESYESAVRVEELFKEAESVFKKYAGMDDDTSNVIVQ